MTEPLQLTFDVACPAEHAFTVWTSAIGTWWPADHTVTGSPAAVVMEGGVGGRIYERAADGTEHDWGEITAWRPPRMLGYLWHLNADRGDATEVEIRFLAQGPDATRIEIEHRGWERLGDRGPAWRERNQIGWQTLLPHFVTAAAAARTAPRQGEGDRQ
jgi:hypothetical protein